MSPVYWSLAAYVPAATLLTITPGLDTALVVRTAATGNARRAALAGLGIATGCFIWAALVAFGLGQLLAASHRAYTALRWLGAAYLLVVGWRMLRRPRQGFDAASATTARGSDGASFATGALTNLLNPKVGVFYVAFLPQFVPPGVAVAPWMLLLGGVHALLGLAWFALLIAATRPLVAWLRRPTVIRGCDRLTGGLFMAFGIGLALESRRP